MRSHRQTGPSRQGHSRGTPFSIPTTSICLLRSRRYLSLPSQMPPGLTRTSLVQPLLAGLLPGSSLLLCMIQFFFFMVLKWRQLMELCFKRRYFFPLLVRRFVSQMGLTSLFFKARYLCLSERFCIRIWKASAIW